MFLVQHQNSTKSFGLFVDAWLYCVLELKSYAFILQGNERWVFNPPLTN